MNSFSRLVLSLLLLAAPSIAVAQSEPSLEPHGPGAGVGFSHRFQLDAHTYDVPQLNIHFGLSQPLVLSGFNAAMDLRVGRWVFEYSHGTNLDFTSNEAIGSAYVGDSGASLESPWTTGAGVGFILLDDLYVMLELKAHHFELEMGDELAEYTTVSLGPALAYRLFLWKGLNVTAYLRYWPNVWSSSQSIELGGRDFEPVDFGLFGNLSVGWAFDVL